MGGLANSKQAGFSSSLELKEPLLASSPSHPLCLSHSLLASSPSLPPSLPTSLPIFLLTSLFFLSP